MHKDRTEAWGGNNLDRRLLGNDVQGDEECDKRVERVPVEVSIAIR